MRRGRSAFKIHLLADAPEITFVLTSGGHNAGIVSPPGHPRRSYRLATTYERDRYQSPEAWEQNAESRSGSWWPEWCEWLKNRSSSPVEAPATGAPASGFRPLDDAPGLYVHIQ